MIKQQLTWKLPGVEGTKVSGNPGPVLTENGEELFFNGSGDGILIQQNPLSGLDKFTVEALFRPVSGGAQIQKFIHFGEPHGNRFLFETRVPFQDQWCFDAALHSGPDGLALVNTSLLHHLNFWYHAAVTCDGLNMTTYINGLKELSGPIPWFRPITGETTSLGVRMDMTHWFRGGIQTIRITPWILDTKDFLKKPLYTEAG